MSILFTRPIPKHTLWGGRALGDYFGFEDLGNDVGQAWVFSAQPGDASQLYGDSYDGWTLEQLWCEHPELFNSRSKQFPFIISLVAPEEDLSIQVHPDDARARACGYPFGKNEAWVFLRAPSEGSIVYGHSAANPMQAGQMVSQGQWTSMIRYLSVSEGDTVYIPAGTLHALRKGSVVYEIQQSTDITYRFYDYDRVDSHGCKRPLQISEALACLHYEQLSACEAKPQEHGVTADGVTESICIQNESFTVRRFHIEQQGFIHKKQYLAATVVAGHGKVDGIPVQVGTSFLIPADERVEICGNVTLLTTAEE